MDKTTFLCSTENEGDLILISLWPYTVINCLKKLIELEN